MLKIMMQFVDTIMAGHVSSHDLAGLASATALYHPVFFPNVRNIDYAGSDYSTTIWVWKAVGDSQKCDIGTVAQSSFCIS